MASPVSILKVLACEPRLKVLRLLKRRSLCVKAITSMLDITQSAVSQHLRVLKEAGLVKAEKRGYWTHYSVDTQALRRHGDMVSGIFDIEG